MAPAHDAAGATTTSAQPQTRSSNKVGARARQGHSEDPLALSAGNEIVAGTDVAFLALARSDVRELGGPFCANFCLDSDLLSF